MKEYLINVEKYEEQHILILVDDSQKSKHYPTRYNIITALRSLVEQSKSGGTSKSRRKKLYVKTCDNGIPVYLMIYTTHFLSFFAFFFLQ